MNDYKSLFGYAAILFGIGFLVKSIDQAYASPSGPNINMGSNRIMDNSSSSSMVVVAINNITNHNHIVNSNNNNMLNHHIINNNKVVTITIIIFKER